MKVNARFRIVYNVVREVEIDQAEFKEWADDRFGVGYDPDLAMAAWIDAQDAEFVADVLDDWRIDSPLPRDFEMQYVETEDAWAPVEEPHEWGS